MISALQQRKESILSNRILVAVDLSNLFYCVKARFAGRRINYRRFLQAAIGESKDWSALAYGSELNGNAEAFKTRLRDIGYSLRYKETKIFLNPDGRQNRKADWDVGIAVELIERIDEYDTLVLGSADGDMASCVDYLKKRGKRVVVIAAGISRDLRQIADECIEITEDFLE